MIRQATKVVTNVHARIKVVCSVLLMLTAAVVKKELQLKLKVKVKQSRYRSGVAQWVPES